ncbi:MAG TPA: DUF4389 domain-containing protein [Actinomycetospora sp.]|jgi:hypothetical protein|uniref:DUF4389 domain-containing protein n=1 Tax=Actinomycetospora sp. TaxID=1872135 RepID=UPI002F3F863E
MTDNPSPPPPPIRVTGRFDPDLSRGLWLVKWLLLIPHLIVLAVLGAAFWVLTVVAFVAILVTGRYPRVIFGFTTGVLRWGWRVAFYGYGANGTDRYPPFTLKDVPDYAARLEIDHPPQLSRGLVLVKWWLLALPHYVVLAFLVGAGGTVVARLGPEGAISFDGGLITLLVLFAVVALLFTRRYPRGIADLVVGLDRWVLRVVAYASLMTDEYPPFRLDQGQDEPSAAPADELPGPDTTPEPEEPPADAAVPAPAPASGSTVLLDRPTAPPQPPVAPPARTVPPPSGGRLALLVVGAMIALLGLGVFGAGVTGLAADTGARNAAGYLTLGPTTSATAGAALRTDPMVISGTEPAAVLGSAQVTATSLRARDLFVGIGPTADVTRYLTGVPQGIWRPGTDGRGGGTVAEVPGGAVVPPPATQPFWAAQSAGPGTRTLTWTPAPGDWSLVVMNADGTTPVLVSVSAGVQAPALRPVSAGVMLAGGALVLLGVVVIVLGARPERGEEQEALAAR